MTASPGLLGVACQGSQHHQNLERLPRGIAQEISYTRSDPAARLQWSCAGTTLQPPLYAVDAGMNAWRWILTVHGTASWLAHGSMCGKKGEGEELR